MKNLVFSAALGLGLTACSPVSQPRAAAEYRDRLSAVSTLHRNVSAFNAHDAELLERTVHPESTELVTLTSEQLAATGTQVSIEGVRVTAQTKNRIEIRYNQTFQWKDGKVMVVPAITTMQKTESGWGILSTVHVRNPVVGNTGPAH